MNCAALPNFALERTSVSSFASLTSPAARLAEAAQRGTLGAEEAP
jgi:hypothetical protein